MPGAGTAINVAAIVAGTSLGLALGGRFPERARTTLLQAAGLVTLAFGVGDALETANVVVPLVALVAGGLIGELVGIEDALTALGERIRQRVRRPVDAEVEGVAPLSAGGAGGNDGGRLGGHTRPRGGFVEGFVAASLLYCVGPLAILGSIQDGLGRGTELLVLKSSLDGLVSIALAARFGAGVGFSVLPVLAYQGAITLAAGAADRVLDDRMVLEMTATGGLLVIGIGLRLLQVAEIRVASLLPALVVAPLLVAGFAR